VVVGDLTGSGASQEQAIVGETPNLAARLQGVAEPNGVVIAESTRRLVGNLFELEDLGTRNLKGIAGPVRALAALRPSSFESRFEALHRTLLREAEQKLHSVNLEDFLDAMIVLEESMRHFYTRAVQLKSMDKHDPKEVDDDLLKAVDIAVQVMPYRHHRLAAIKLDKDPVFGEVGEHASLAELEAEMKKHWLRLAPILDLEALVAPAATTAEEPSDGIANREGFEEEPEE
jgi:hypothetical protein